MASAIFRFSICAGAIAINYPGMRHHQWTSFFSAGFIGGCTTCMIMMDLCSWIERKRLAKMLERIHSASPGE